MPARSPSRHETWRDWIGPKDPDPDHLYTRDQVAELASRSGEKVTGDDLRYWEYQGVLPRSVRQWHEGAARAVYPPWYVGLARMVRELQRRGYTLAEITDHIRDTLKSRKHLGKVFSVDLEFSEFTDADPELVTTINRLAVEVAEQDGSPISNIELIITLADGSGHVLSIPVRDSITDRDLQ